MQECINPGFCFFCVADKRRNNRIGMDIAVDILM